MNDKVLVQNLADHSIVYLDNDGGVERRININPQQQIELPRDMIERMQYDQGGSVLLRDYLSVKDEDIRQAIGVPSDQIEYDFTRDDVLDLLKNNKVDSIADALDFGPQAIVDMIVDEAVSLPVNNREVIALIAEKTGKNIETMIKLKEELETDVEEEDTPKIGRRVQVAESAPTRRVSSGKDIVIPQ